MAKIATVHMVLGFADILDSLKSEHDMAVLVGQLNLRDYRRETVPDIVLIELPTTFESLTDQIKHLLHECELEGIPTVILVPPDLFTSSLVRVFPLVYLISKTSYPDDVVALVTTLLRDTDHAIIPERVDRFGHIIPFPRPFPGSIQEAPLPAHVLEALTPVRLRARARALAKLQAQPPEPEPPVVHALPPKRFRNSRPKYYPQGDIREIWKRLKGKKVVCVGSPYRGETHSLGMEMYFVDMSAALASIRRVRPDLLVLDKSVNTDLDVSALDYLRSEFVVLTLVVGNEHDVLRARELNLDMPVVGVGPEIYCANYLFEVVSTIP